MTEPAAALSPAEELLKLGRDREAVAAAARDSATAAPTRGGHPMDGAQQLDEIIPMLHALVERITSEQLDRPTPCATFSVAGVLEHMIGGATAFAPAFRGEVPAENGAAVSDASPQDRFHRAMDDLVNAAHAPGADERTIAAPFGDVPGSVFARFVAFDGLVHGYDLAIGTGQNYAPRAELVAEVDAFARSALQPAMRDGDTFAAETPAPAGATPMERLVAFSGRQLATS